jgi:hypothetical protein
MRWAFYASRTCFSTRVPGMRLTSRPKLGAVATSSKALPHLIYYTEKEGHTHAHQSGLPSQCVAACAV